MRIWPGFYVMALAGLLLSCVVSQNLTPPQSLFDIQTRYTKIGAVVLHYVSLPSCSAPESVITVAPCAEEEVVQALRWADQEIYTVLIAAEVARGTVDAEAYRKLAASALGRLRAVIAANLVREALQ